MRTRLRVFAAIAALVGWGAPALQLTLTFRTAAESGWGSEGILFSFFGFFANLTVILAAVAFTSLALPDSRAGRLFAQPSVISAVTAAMVLVGLAYSLLLRRTWHREGWEFVADEALYDVMPLLVLAYWWIAVPRGSVHWRDVPRWMAWPVAYLVYVLLRGAATGLYPYNFLSVDAIGYGRAFVNALFALLGFAAIALALVGASTLKKREAAPVASQLTESGS